MGNSNIVLLPTPTGRSTRHHARTQMLPGDAPLLGLVHHQVHSVLPVFEETRSIISVLTTTVIALSLEAHIMTPITLTTAHRPPDGDVQRRVLSVVGCRA